MMDGVKVLIWSVSFHRKVELLVLTSCYLSLFCYPFWDILSFISHYLTLFAVHFVTFRHSFCVI